MNAPILLTVVCLLLPCAARAQGPAELPALADVFVSGDDGYRTYRIPSVLCTPKGTLLAFCEGRKYGAADQGPTDLVLKRSFDGGRSWGPMQIVVRAVPHAAMDPCPVVDRSTGHVWLVFDRWPAQVKDQAGKYPPRKPGLGLDSITTWVITSQDDGATWAKLRDITATTKNPQWAGTAHGPGVGIQTRSGRLVIPCNHYEHGRGVFVIFSDNHGATWQLGGETGPQMSESQVVELADGRLMLNMRSCRGRHCRAAAFSSDGGQTWTEPADVPELVEPFCQGSILRYSLASEGGRNRLLFANPGDPRQRVKMTVRLSYDEGATWPVAKTIYEGSSAYGCLSVLADGSIGCLFERDRYAALTFARLTLGWLTDGQDAAAPAQAAAIQPTAPPEPQRLTLPPPIGQELPAGWRFVGGAWQTKALARALPPGPAVAAVTAERHVAFPGICRTRQGTLLIVYREGYSHASGNPDDGRVMLVRSTDHGRHWGPPELVTDDPAADDRNAAIACAGDGTLGVIFDKWLLADSRRNHHWAWLTTSGDEGRTWTAPLQVSSTEDVHTRSRLLDLGQGSWLIPYSESTSSKTEASFVSLFDPRAKTFEEIAVTPRGQRNLADEIAVTRAANGDLVALIRSNVDPELFQSVSRDGGRSWSEARPSGIPSQFTPADLITLQSGWLLASFSFRERHNERLVVSRDDGRTWDVENSVSVFRGTRSVGSDRSYPASVELEDGAIGTVLYETQAPPVGGTIWFVTTPAAALNPPKQQALYQADASAEAAFALWPSEACGRDAEFGYRFTGRFGLPPHRVGMLLAYQDPANYTAFEFQMGAPRDLKGHVNWVQLVQCQDGKLATLQEAEAGPQWFDDGDVHRLGAHRQGEQWILTIDGLPQMSAPASLGGPCGCIVRRAAVAFTEGQ